MYDPPRLFVQVGRTVQWKNTGNVIHSINDDPRTAMKASDALLPSNAKPFLSGDVMPGATYKHTFTVPGRYRYFCTTHEKDKMIGEIVVEPLAARHRPSLGIVLEVRLSWELTVSITRKGSAARVILNEPRKWL